jgi:hypothetical protein
MDGFIPAGKYVIDTKARPSPISVYTELLNQLGDPDHPECVAFRKKHRDPRFQQRAKTLDKRARAIKRQLVDEANDE